MAKRLGSIFEYMKTDTYITAAELVKKTGLSERTIRSRVKEIDVILEKHGANIFSKQHHGYMLQIKDENLYKLFLEQIHYKENGFLPSNTKERVNLLLAYFIANRKRYVKIENLMDYFYCSSNTVSNDIKKAEERFAQYNIVIERRPNYGMRIKGKEFDIRFFNAICILQDNHFYFGDEKKKHMELQDISICLHHALIEYKISVNEIAFDFLIKILYAQVKNIMHGYGFCRNEFDFPIIEENILNCARYLKDSLEVRFSLQLSDDELYYIAFHISANRTIDEIQHNFVITEDIIADIQKMLISVKNSFSIDLTKDMDIQLSLAKHYVPFKIRLQYGLQLENPLLNVIKEKYVFAMEISKEALLPIALETNKEISEHEISYFALIFEYALEKKQQIKRKRNILLICTSGEGSTKLLLYKLHSEFKDYIDCITVKTLFTLVDKDFCNIDFIFTTVPIHRPVPVPVVEINTFLGNQQLNDLKTVFKASEKKFLDDCFREELFFPNIHANTYEQAIKIICDKIKQLYPLSDDFYNSIIKREHIASTDFGNLVAIPHPYRSLNTDMISAVAILDKPILWSKKQVQVIFLFSLNLKKEDAKIFYKSIVEFANDANMISNLISTRDYDFLLRELKRENIQE